MRGSAAELDALRAGALVSRSPGFGVFVACLIDSGARKGELLERRWADVNLDKGEIAADYDPIAPLFVELGLSLLVWDYRGYGRSGGRPGAQALLERVPEVAGTATVKVSFFPGRVTSR